MINKEWLFHIGYSVQFIAFATAVIQLKKWQINKSGFLGTAIFLCVNGIGLYVEPFVTNNISTIDVHLGRVIFFGGLATIDLIAIWLIVQLHKNIDVPFSFSSRFVIRVFQILALIQMVRLVDREFGLNALEVFYNNSIPILNSCIVIVLACELFKNLFRQRSVKGG